MYTIAPNVHDQFVRLTYKETYCLSYTLSISPGVQFWTHFDRLTMTMINDNDYILFDYNVQIAITIFNSLENQIINWSGDYY